MADRREREGAREFTVFVCPECGNYYGRDHRSRCTLHPGAWSDLPVLERVEVVERGPEPDTGEGHKQKRRSPSTLDPSIAHPLRGQPLDAVYGRMGDEEFQSRMEAGEDPYALVGESKRRSSSVGGGQPAEQNDTDYSLAEARGFTDAEREALDAVLSLLKIEGPMGEVHWPDFESARAKLRRTT